MKILIGVCGSISAYKVLDVISGLISKDHSIRVIPTESANDFVTSKAIGSIGGEIMTETTNHIEHIELANWCDMFVIVSATANTMSKMANGIADNFLTSTYLAIPKGKPILIFPAMNTNMLEHPTTIRNFGILQNDGIKIYPTRKGKLACGAIGFGKLLKPRDIVRLINDYALPVWQNPLPLSCKGLSNNSNSFFDINLEFEYEILIHPHCGSFGVRRRHDYHKGVDLYAPSGTPIYAVESGYVMDVCPFTGKDAGCDWWNDTFGVYIGGKSGIVVYGEMKPREHIKKNVYVHAGECIGEVVSVLKKDKGRPISMLHLELHEKNCVHTEMWEIGKPKPGGLLDPTPYLIKMKEEWIDD